MATDAKKQIVNTFMELAKQKGMDKVTISMVVSECGISRQAFYYYFQDIVDVARYSIQNELRFNFDTALETMQPENATKTFCEHFTSSFPLISIALNSKLRAEMELLLIKELRKFFTDILLHWDCGRGMGKKQIDFHSDFIACAITSLAIEHCNDFNFDTNDFSNSLWEILSRTYN